MFYYVMHVVPNETNLFYASHWADSTKVKLILNVSQEPPLLFSFYKSSVNKTTESCNIQFKIIFSPGET
jgi:hypothetical protein